MMQLVRALPILQKMTLLGIYEDKEKFTVPPVQHLSLRFGSPFHDFEWAEARHTLKTFRVVDIYVSRDETASPLYLDFLCECHRLEKVVLTFNHQACADDTFGQSVADSIVVRDPSRVLPACDFVIHVILRREAMSDAVIGNLDLKSLSANLQGHFRSIPFFSCANVSVVW